jgi:hypothetical protein
MKGSSRTAWRTTVMKLFTRLVGATKPALSRNTPVKNVGCTEFEIDAWQMSSFVLERLVPVVGTHPFPLHELMLLASTVCRFQPSHIFEWGTNIGKSARAFYEVVQHFDIPAVIHSVDLPDDVQHQEHPSDHRGRMVLGLDRVHLHQGDGLQVSLDLWSRAGKPDGALFFIDGDHSEASVYRELSTIVGEIPQPVALLHDAFYQSPLSGYNVGPHRAIERVLKENPGRFRRIDSGLGLPGMALIYTPASQ